MDKYIRNQIIEMLSTVREGIQHINSVSTQGVLIDDCIMALKSIDEACKNGFSKERYRYYQQIFDGVSNSLLEAKELTISANDLQELCTLSCELLDFISKALMQELEVKKEILFLPYKASMWDSLESIWLAAKEDSNCDAYVMPIPYYDLGPDRKAVAMHYEGNQFPDYVPITDYRKYDIGKRKPDIIYIHNPYDGYNRVTSVDPAYYSSELKKYTDMLVYVPYFVSGQKIVEHFCQIPGVLYADKVIVQSDIIKEQYERYYPGGNPPKDKFLALGSPKFDKVLKCKREDFILPDEWKRMIAGKKVVLYNTHLSEILNYPDKIFNKLRYVFSCFKDREDVVLWWRPHPLGKATTQAMQPVILEEYKAVEREFRESKIGIFDDTADLHRAISWSDAYYGDTSSLVWLYSVTGKPLMIQNVDFMPIPFSFCDYAIYNDELWFVPSLANLIFKINLKTREFSYEKMANEITNDSQIFGGLVKTESKIIAFPFRGNEFIEYDLGKKKKEIRKLPNIEKRKNDGNMMFTQAIKFKNHVVFCGYDCPVIVKYNTLTGQYQYFTEWVKEVEKFIGENKIYIWFCCVKENSIFFAIYQTNLVVEFDIEKERAKIYKVGDNNRKYVGIEFDGKNFWITPSHGNEIIKWHKEMNLIEEISDYPRNVKIESASLNPFLLMISGNGYIWLFKNWCEEKTVVIKIDINTTEITEVTELGDLGRVAWAKRISDTEFTVTSTKNKKIYFWKINLVTLEREKIEICLQDKQIEELQDMVIAEQKRRRELGTGYMWYEVYGLSSLEKFLQCIKKDEVIMNVYDKRSKISEDYMHKKAGNLIHQSILYSCSLL